MSITKKDVERVAELARLAITDKEAVIYTEQLSRILSHVEVLSKVDTEGVAATSSTPAGLSGARPDVVIGSLKREDALKNAPEKEDGFFKVSQIIE